MEQRVIAAAAAMLLAATVPGFSQTKESGIETNARGGFFSSDRRFWFSAPEGQRLRLTVNGNETYRGVGPASSIFAAKPGEERSFELTVERRTAPPEDEVLETRSYLVRIDAAPPQPVKTTGSRLSDSSWTLLFTAEEGSRVVAIVDADSRVSLHEDVRESLVVEGRKVRGLAWCVDRAGNASVPAPFSFEPFALSVVNPVPGVWANRQRLIVSASGASSVRWSDDGQDPMGPTGKTYEAPVLIDKTGAVVLKVAASFRDGRVETREVAYRSGTAETPGTREAETATVTEETAVAVPSGSRWDIGHEGAASAAAGGDPSFTGGEAVTLRPVAGVLRYVPFLIKDDRGMFRYVFSLGASATPSDSALPREVAPAQARGATAVPVPFNAGSARAFAWNRSQGTVRYRWKGSDAWNDGILPVAVPVEGGVLEWLVEKGAVVEGPFSLAVPAVSAGAAFPDQAPKISGAGAGSATLSPSDPSAGVRFVLGLPSLEVPVAVELSSGESLRLDSCDGEQLTWTVSGRERSVFVETDRRPPPLPRISAPEEGSWVRTAPIVSCQAAEGRIEAFARWRDEDGGAGSVVLNGPTTLRSLRKGPLEYVLEARTVDAAGNRSDAVLRSFTVDESTIYLSNLVREGTTADGSRTAPYFELQEALDAARSRGSPLIRISGVARVRGRVKLPDGVSLEGGFDQNWNRTGVSSELLFEAGAGFSVESGTSKMASLRLVESGGRAGALLSVSGASLDLLAVTAEGPAPTVSVGAGSKLRIRGSSLSGSSPVVEASQSEVTISDSLVSAATGIDGRSYGLSVADSTLSLESSRVEAGSAEPAAVALCIDATGGGLRMDQAVLVSGASDSAGGVVARGVTVDATASEVDASASSYAYAVSAAGGSTTFSGGKLSVSARDSAASVVDAPRFSRFDAVSFTVEGRGVVRAVQSRGAFPEYSACRFEAPGSPAGSEALAGDAPSSGSVRGNVFSGFAYLYDRDYSKDDIAAFNGRFAGNGPTNEYAAPIGKR